jgi:hypothetical protein
MQQAVRLMVMTQATAFSLPIFTGPPGSGNLWENQRKIKK